MRVPVLVAVALLVACGPGTRPELTPTPTPTPTPAPTPRPTPTPGAAIAAPNETWTWVGFPDSTCGNGVATGIGVNLTSRTTDVFVYFAGGGACWDETTCFVVKAAANLDSGYVEASFASDSVKAETGFSRTDAANPWKDMSFVYVPYCTGDLHAGDNVKTYSPAGGPVQVHHVGGRNVDAFLARLMPTFPGARRIFVAGSSAGGYAAQILYDRFAAAFPAAEVHALADGAQLVPTPDPQRYAAFQATWKLSLPPGCAACSTDPRAIASNLVASHPSRRFGLLANLDDPVLRPFLAYNPFAPDPAFEAATRAALGIYEVANARHFALVASGHTMLRGLSTTVGPAPGNVTLSSWLKSWVDGGAGWTSVGP